MLHEPAEEVKKEDIGSAHIEKTVNDMVATMRNAPGVGLAAPQIGVPLQVHTLHLLYSDTSSDLSYSIYLTYCLPRFEQQDDILDHQFCSSE